MMTTKKQTPQQIHDENIVPGAMAYATIIQQYAKLTESWKFIGYRCIKCDNPFKSKLVLLNHVNVCRVINSISKKKKE